jgi:hypothetical protein
MDVTLAALLAVGPVPALGILLMVSLAAMEWASSLSDSAIPAESHLLESEPRRADFYARRERQHCLRLA